MAISRPDGIVAKGGTDAILPRLSESGDLFLTTHGPGPALPKL
jgi:hypothetical protein